MASEDRLKAELLGFAHRLADAAGAAIMPHYRTGTAAQDKSEGARFDPVTVADRAAEQAIRDLIVAAYPAHGIIGEEFGSDNTEAEFVWVLDPIDGTKSFITAIPLWGTLIGLLHGGEPFLGLSDHPFLKERFWGDGHTASGSSAARNWALTSRKPVPLRDAVVFAGSSVADNPALFSRLMALTPRVRMIRFGSDCYDTCMLAEGHIDAVLQTGLDIYDIAATVPIVTGAGGIVTGLDGGPAIHARTILTCGDPALHAVLLPLLAPDAA
jgi:histidinol phosphatase-like enzyme (inositol monophosphatase family)